MRTDRFIQSLENLGNFLPGYLDSLSDEDARWKPPSQNWSILEIVRHLIDEEQEDFRTRIRMTLENPDATWPSINPEFWAIDRRYNESNFQDSLIKFVDQRRESVKWLRNLEDPNWFAVYEHPNLGPIRAGDLLASWVAHDQLHIRQIAKRRFEMISRDAGEFSTSYAGDLT